MYTCFCVIIILYIYNEEGFDKAVTTKHTNFKILKKMNNIFSILQLKLLCKNSKFET